MNDVHFKLNRNRDRYGILIKHPGDDGGDSAQREGTFYAAMSWLGEMQTQGHRYTYAELFAISIKNLSVPNKPGNYRRHPDDQYWYSHGNIMSRDQMTPLIIAMGEYGMYKRLLWAMFRWLLRLGFMNNTRRNGMYENEKEHYSKRFRDPKWDYTWKLPDFAPFHLGLYIRSFRCYPLWPLLVVLDLYLVLGSVSKYLRGRYYKILPYNWHRKVTGNGDDINHIIVLLQSKERLTTPVSYIARWVYKRRPFMKEFGSLPKYRDYEPKTGGQSALQVYFSTGEEPRLDLLLKPLVEAL